MEQIIRINNFPPTQNELRRMHHMRVAKEKAEWERIVWFVTKEQKIKPVKKAAVTYEFFFKDNKKRDPDNYAACAKMIQDGLVKAGILPDDNFDVVQEFAIRKGGISDTPHILVRLKELSA